MKPFVVVSFTNYCNIGCGYCVAQSYDWVMTDKSRPRKVDFLDYKKFITWMETHWPEDTMVHITGGEPTLHPEAAEAIEAISKKYRTVVFTNGISIPKKILDNSPDVFWNFTYHATTAPVPFDQWIEGIKPLLGKPYRISYLDKLVIPFESDYNVDFRAIGKGDLLADTLYEYDTKPTATRFCLVTPDGLVYACNLCGTLITAAKQPVTDEDMDIKKYFAGPPRKKEHIGNIATNGFNVDKAKLNDKHVRDCLRYKKCWACLTQARIEHYAKIQEFI